MSQYSNHHQPHSEFESGPFEFRSDSSAGSQSATPGIGPVWIRHLSPPDGEVLDGLLAARNGYAQIGLAQHRDPQRVRRMRSLLKLLDALPEYPDSQTQSKAGADESTEQRQSRSDRESVAGSSPAGKEAKLADSAAAEGAVDTERVRRTVEAVRIIDRRRRFMAAYNEVDPTAGGGIGWGRVAMAALAVMFGLSLLLPVLDHNRSEAQRIACASNLQAAGAGFNSYAADHGGVLPRGRVQPGAPWWHVGEAPSEHDPVVRSNSAHLYLLVRGGGYVKPDELACPTNPHAPWGEMDARHYDWRSPEEVSYSYQNQYTEQPWRIEQHSYMAVLADKNPLFVARQGRVFFDPDTPFDAPSRAHNQRGQNVLLLDGRVVWTSRPILQHPVPFHETNIWVAEGVERYTGTELPGSRQDSFLVP